MAKDLKALIKIQKYNLDEKRRMLADLHSKEDYILEQLQLLANQLEIEKKTASENPAFAFNYDAYLDAYMEQKDMFLDKLDSIRKIIEKVQEEVADEFRKLKTYEMTQEKREKEEKYEQDRKEQYMLDEIGTNLYIRRHSSSDEEKENGHPNQGS
jgi:flagellar export protein FliJ